MDTFRPQVLHDSLKPHGAESADGAWRRAIRLAENGALQQNVGGSGSGCRACTAMFRSPHGGAGLQVSMSAGRVLFRHIVSAAGSAAHLHIGGLWPSIRSSWDAAITSTALAS